MGLVSCVRWLPAYMRQTSTVMALTAGSMDSALAGNVDFPLFGTYVVGDAECEQVKTRYTVYVPPPFVVHLLGQELTARQAWDRLRGGGGVHGVPCFYLFALLVTHRLETEEGGVHVAGESTVHGARRECHYCSGLMHVRRQPADTGHQAHHNVASCPI